MREVQAAAHTLGLEVATLEIRRAQDIAQSRADALYVCPEGLASTDRIRVNTSALGERLPTMRG